VPIFKAQRGSSKKNTRQQHQYESVTLTPYALSDDGRGLADDESGRKVFIDGALPEETVVATIMKDSRHYRQAKVKEVLSPSPERIEPPCLIFKRCGGCSVQYMSQSQQLNFKQNAVLSQLSRWADITPQDVLPMISYAGYQYRQRIRLSVDYHKNGDLYLGFHEPNSRRVVNVNECMVIEPLIQSLLPLLRSWLLSIKPKLVGHIEVVSTDTAIGVVIRHTRPLSVDDRQMLQVALEDENMPIELWFQGEKRAALESVEAKPTDPRLSYRLEAFGLCLQFHPQDFIQSNHDVNQAMVAQAIELMDLQPNECVMDLFCGIGNFSLPLAQKARWVIGIEGVSQMVERARHNAEINQISNVSFAVQDLADDSLDIHSILSNIPEVEQIDALLLDPPRSGAKEISQQIMKLAPKRIVYVSCDSSTFARDAKILAGNGYLLSRLGVIDMFPQTSHIELMGLFISQ